MKRRMFNLLAGVSLLLCVLAIVLWIRSGRRWDALVIDIGSTRSISVRSTSGATEVRLRSGGEPEGFSTQFGWKPDLPPPQEDSASGYSDVLTFPADGFFTSDIFWENTFRIEHLGVEYRRAKFMHSEYPACPAGTFTSITISDAWITALLALASLTFFFRAQRSRQRDRDGKCIECGYDLRATPERCPECGGIPGG